MKVFTLIFLLTGTLACNYSNAQSILGPCDREISGAYYTGVDKIINDAVGRPSQLQLTTLPSFQAESGVRLAGLDVYFVQLTSFYWGSAFHFDSQGNGHMDFARSPKGTEVRHAPLSPAIAYRVEQMYAKAIGKAKESGNMGLDGVNYIISTSPAACGSAWSPDPGSPNGRLVQLMMRLEKHASFSSQIDLRRSEKSIERLLQTMESD